MGCTSHLLLKHRPAWIEMLRLTLQPCRSKTSLTPLRMVAPGTAHLECCLLRSSPLHGYNPPAHIKQGLTLSQTKVHTTTSGTPGVGNPYTLKLNLNINQHHPHGLQQCRISSAPAWSVTLEEALFQKLPFSPLPPANRHATTMSMHKTCFPPSR